MESKKVWNINHEKRYNALYNKLVKEQPDLDKKTYLLNYNKKNLQTYISKLPLSDGTKESFYFMIARYLEINKPNDTTISNFKTAGYKLKTKSDNKEANNELDEREKESYKSYTYFTQILDSIDKSTLTKQKQHYEYLLLSLLVKQPPLRTSFYTSAIITDSNNHDDDKNYVWLTFKGKKRAYYIINKDKVSNTRSYKDKRELTLIEIEDSQLVDLLYESYKKYPRTYLFQYKTKPLGDISLIKYLRSITKLPKINIDIMRSIYITNFYTNNKSLKSKQELALKMRHSVATAEKNYFKIIAPTKTNEDTNKELESLRQENDKLKAEIYELKQKLLQLQPDEAITLKRKNDILYRLNKLKAVVKQDTLDKYNIKYDEELKKYT